MMKNKHAESITPIANEGWKLLSERLKVFPIGAHKFFTIDKNYATNASNMRVLLAADEFYPVYKPERHPSEKPSYRLGRRDALVDVPEETVWRWEAACSAWDEVQKEMERAVEAVNL